MRRTPLVLLTITALSLAACGKGEVKTGNLTQRFHMVDEKGVHFGVVELDPINGGSIIDVEGRVVGRIMPPAQATATATVAQFTPAPLPVVQ